MRERSSFVAGLDFTAEAVRGSSDLPRLMMCVLPACSALPITKCIISFLTCSELLFLVSYCSPGVLEMRERGEEEEEEGSRGAGRPFLSGERGSARSDLSFLTAERVGPF